MGVTLSKMNRSKSKKVGDEFFTQELKPHETPKTFKLEETLDRIAADTILKMDMQTLEKLNEKEYCDKMMILSSEILGKDFTHLELQKIAKRLHKGTQIMGETDYEMKLPSDVNTEETDTVFYIKKEVLREDPIHKKEMCDEIAKFYIKIAHLFSAIMKTVNPEYIYKDFFGNIIRTRDKDSIPKNTSFQLYKLNLCNQRLNTLLGKNNVDEMIYLGTDEKKINVEPDFCSIHIKSNGEIKTLEEEPGIPELMNLYYDADYDYKTGEFRGMSDAMKEIFQHDLQEFYKTFTGNELMPPSITKFGDIKLHDYRKNSVCTKGEQNEMVGNYKDKLFNLYSRNINEMIFYVNEKQEKLLNILTQVFLVPEGKGYVKIQPNFTENNLQLLIEETRICITELYIHCEEKFIEGIQIYEAIVESNILHTTHRQIEHLEKLSEKIYGGSE